MLISDAHRLVFVHVPKTGGVSIDDVLRGACPDARSVAADGTRISRHATLERIMTREEQLADYWSFGFVRNPWARLLSWYSMIQRWDRHGRRGGNQMWHRAADYADFTEFVVRGTEELPRVGVAQVDYLRSPAFGREVDFVGRTESLARDLEVVQRHLGVTPTPPPHRNKSRRRSYHDHYTPAARAKVEDVYAADLEAFGYTY